MPNNVRAHAIITGKVQGVWFRVETQQAARSHGVKGWVRNKMDGSVEAVFEGPRPPVEAVLEWCHQGPAIARVDAVDVQWEDFKGEFDGFSITG